MKVIGWIENAHPAAIEPCCEIDQREIHACDPKVGELCVAAMKACENGLEVVRVADVQIAPMSCV